MFDFLQGDIVEGVTGLVKHFTRGKMSESEQSDAKISIMALAANISEKAQAAFDQRIKEMEGTAKDLMQFGWIGKILIMLRGLQRPVWGFGTLYLDYMWFSGQWTFSEEQSNAAYVINFLVLGFLFGERTIKNLEPLLVKIFAK